jgi:hypothetical protein
MKFVWPDSARSELRGIDQESAMRILVALTRTVNPARETSRPCPGNGMDTSAFARGTFG